MGNMKSINQNLEEIEKKPPTPMDRVIAAILRFPPVFRKMHREVFSRGQNKVGIAIANHHVMIMKVLHETGTLSSTEIGEVLCVSKSQMTHSTEKLMKLGLIKKSPDNIDRRKVNIALTPKGQATVRKIDKVLLDIIHERLSSISDDDLEKLAESFDNIVEVFSK